MPRPLRTRNPPPSARKTPSSGRRRPRPRAIRQARSATSSQRVAVGPGTMIARWSSHARCGVRYRSTAASATSMGRPRISRPYQQSATIPGTRRPMPDPKTRTQKIDALVERMLAGDRLALARLITQVENRTEAVPAVMRAIHPRAQGAYVVGVTGPPGAGKSTVVDRLIALLRAREQTVGVVAVDPSSPFTGGAVLGDRIRMQAHALDPGVFIRSMATRGAFGGLARATGDVIKLLAAFGFPWILIETVGVGQTELDIMKLADTTVVILVPESGDAIQTMKAGLLEAADVFVVNKADRTGAPALMAELKFAAHLASTSPTVSREVDWEIPVLATEAQNNGGMAELLDTVARHRAALEGAGALAERRRARRRDEFKSLLVEEFRASVDRMLRSGDLAQTFDRVADGQLDPYSAAELVLAVLSLGRS